jgi:hypothetical protein
MRKPPPSADLPIAPPILKDQSSETIRDSDFLIANSMMP